MRKVYLSFFVVLTFGVLWIQACGSKNNPTAPSVPKPTDTPNVTMTPTGSPTPIAGLYLYASDLQYIYNEGTVSLDLDTYLTVNGSPVTNVNVVLSSPALSMPVTEPYYGPQTVSGVVYGYYQNTAGGWNYQAGQVYTLTLTDGAIVGSASVTAPGGITEAADGSQSSWTVNGKTEEIYVQPAVSSSFLYLTYSPTSPWSIPVTAYTGGGVFKLTTQLSNYVYSISGGSSTNGFKILDSYTQAVTIATPTFTPTGTLSITATYTPTVTFTPTNTATPTPSRTPTNTPTNSFTGTSTNSFTPTPSFTPTKTATNSLTPTTTSTATDTPTNSPTNTLTSTPTSTSTLVPTPSYQSSFSISSKVHQISYAFPGISRLLIPDPNTNTVLETSTNGTLETTWGSNGNGNGQFTVPYDAVMDGSGNLYVADSYNNRVQMLNSTGTWVWTTGGISAGSGVSQFNFPTAAALDGSGNLWVGDLENTRLVSLNASTGAWQNTYTGINIQALAIDQTNQLIYSAADQNVSVYKTNGTYVRSWGGNGTGPGKFEDISCVALSSDGSKVYIGDSINNNVQVFDDLGNLLDSWGGSGSGTYQYGTNSPSGIAVDLAGNVYVADPGNGYIKVYSGTP